MEEGNKEVANEGGVKLLPAFWILDTEGGVRLGEFNAGAFGNRVVMQRIAEALEKKEAGL